MVGREEDEKRRQECVNQLSSKLEMGMLKVTLGDPGQVDMPRPRAPREEDGNQAPSWLAWPAIASACRFKDKSF